MLQSSYFVHISCFLLAAAAHSTSFLVLLGSYFYLRNMTVTSHVRRNGEGITQEQQEFEAKLQADKTQAMF
jgi:hypothetical protein